MSHSHNHEHAHDHSHGHGHGHPDRARILALFDVDGTLSPARLHATDDMKALLARLR